MRLAVRVVCGWLAAVCLVWGADGMQVWAIGDTVRIDPIRSRAFEENPKLFPDGVGGDYKNSNLVWDGASRRIAVHAARNETVAFQIVIERTAAKLSNVKVELGELTGPNGSHIPAANVDLFREWYVQVETPSERNVSLGPGWYPDALLPCLRWSGNLYPHTYVMPFDLPDPLNYVGETQKSQAMWVDVYVPNQRAAAPAGSYTAPITITSDQGSAQLTLELKVWDFALPEESHLKPNIHTDTEVNTFAEDLELKYYQLLRKHRLSMYPLGYAPALTVSGADVKIDWSKYDARLGKYLDGSAFTGKYGYNGPGYGVPIEFLMLPFDAYPMNLYKLPRGIQKNGKEYKFYAAWPVSLPKEGRTPEYQQIWTNTFRAVEKHFDDHPGWDKTRLLVYFLSLDEAYDDVARERMFYYGQLLKDAHAPRLEYRVDGSYPKETMERLAKILNIVILGMRSWQKAGVDEIKKQGVNTWFYTGSVVTDGDGLNARSLSWLAWKLGADSWTLWELDFNSLRAWQEPKTYGNYNGLGMLVYRGETMGLDEPVPSMRLKGLRRGSQDYEYFWLLSQTPGGKQAVDEAVNGVLHGGFGERDELGMPAMWNHDPDTWDRVRLKLGEAIERNASKGQ
jgi:Glycoside hydrolase 123 N-terminal domain